MSRFRNLSPQEMFVQMALNHEPEEQFKGESYDDFTSWKERVYPKVISTLGIFPEKVDLNPELLAEWEQDGLRKQKWVIDVGKNIAATFYINFPSFLSSGKTPAILCWHGHGDHGTGGVMGNNDASRGMPGFVKTYNHDYGHQMAKNGFITFAIDWMGQGERNDSARPVYRSLNRDWCDAYYNHATLLGMTSLGINLTHGKAATDFACTFPEVDANHLGVMGFSGGGTMTLWSALCDSRFKSAEIICYSTLFQISYFRDISYCGMQITPRLFRLVDLPDLQGLLAPMPLLVDIAVHDNTFPVEAATSCYQKVEEIYQAADATNDLHLDLFAGGHSWGGNKSVDFFNKYLTD